MLAPRVNENTKVMQGREKYARGPRFGEFIVDPLSRPDDVYVKAKRKLFRCWNLYLCLYNPLLSVITNKTSLNLDVSFLKKRRKRTSITYLSFMNNQHPPIGTNWGKSQIPRKPLVTAHSHLYNPIVSLFSTLKYYTSNFQLIKLWQLHGTCYTEFCVVKCSSHL